MKILSLNLTNLNSLKGSWHIDFSDDAFVRDGIFAIIGQTGAGKTTILDAICLAIYGQTPRIKQISANQNELMSLGTGECAAQAEIALGGKIYRFSWQQRRAGGKADGKLQPIRREISELKHAGDPDGIILESKPSLCDKKAVEIMHMNFEQFTRSVMLAQGNFAAFLKADASEKGEILERITGTEIYAKISAKVFDTEKQKRSALNALEDRLSEHAIMNDDEYNALLAHIKDDETTLATLKNSLATTEQIIKKLEQKQQHETNISQLTTALADHKQALDDFRPNLSILENANKAFELQSDYTAISHLTAQQRQYQNEQHELSDNISSTTTALTNSQTQQAKTQQDLARIKETQEQALPVFRQVRELDGQISRTSEQLLDLQSTYDKYTQDLQTIAQDLANQAQRKTRTEHEISQITAKICARPHDDGQQIGLLTAYQSEFDRHTAQLTTLYQNIANTKHTINSLNTTLSQKRQDYKDTNKTFKDHDQQLHTLHNQLATLLNQPIQNIDDHALSQHIETLSQDSHACTQLTSTLDVLLTALDEKQSTQEQIANAQHQSKLLSTQSEQYTQKINQLEDKIKQEQNTLIALERTFALENENAALQKHLNKLTQGTPCPLCGSTQHPYKDKHHDANLTANLDNPADSTATAIDHTKQRLNELNIEHQNTTKTQVTTDTNLENINNNLQSSYEKIHTLSQRITNLHTQILPLCQRLSFEVNDISHDTIFALIDSCKHKQAWLHSQTNECKQLNLALKNTQNLVNQANEKQQAIIQEGESLKKQVNLHEDNLEKQLTDLHNLSLSMQDTLTKITAIVHQFDNSNTPNRYQHLFDIMQNLQNINDDGFAQLTDFNIDILEKINNIHQEYQAHQHNIAQKQELERQLDGIVIHINHQQKTQQTLQQDNQVIINQIQNISLKINDLTKERTQLFGNRDIDEEEQSLRQQLENAQKLVNDANSSLNQHQQSLTILQQRLMVVDTELTQLNEHIDKQWADFRIALADKGFADEQQFLAARIDNNQRTALSEKADALHYAIKKTTDGLHQEQQNLATLASTIDTHESLDKLYADKENNQNQERVLLQNLGKNQQILAHAQKQREQHTALAEQIREKKQDIEVWAKLNKLIGSKEGEKYRNFVQGLTLDMMLYFANEILSSMSERYILCHSDDDKLLEINIIDTHQGNEERSTKNLSGGESFIISLALALGLSKMSSENVNIDSLFLDEGFGTLDEEILDIALATLAALQDEGKTIGIISHVASLKERIGTQIIVHKEANGTSRLTGVGISRSD